MNVKLRQSEICGEVYIPPSKSVAHRMMICAALSGVTLDVADTGKDVAATAACLAALSPHIKKLLNKSLDESVPTAVLNAGESGSTLRFLLPVVCAIGGEYTFKGEGRLSKRPVGGLLRTLESRGIRVASDGNGGLPLTVSGRLTAGEFKIDGSVSSQYITGLLLALPLLDGNSEIIIEGESVSLSYIDITLGVLNNFGITVKKTERGFLVGGNQVYVLPQDCAVEGDWSSAGFMLALGVLAGKVKLLGLKENSLQGDKIAVELLRKAGADIEIQNGAYVAKKSKLNAIDFDASDCPDAVPIMATALSFAEGESHIFNVDRLKDKESDRLSAIMSMLGAFGIETRYLDGVLTVCGGEHKACETHGFNDHRMAMSAMVCALATEGDSVVKGVECISKSYPQFIEDIIALGARVQVV